MLLAYVQKRAFTLSGAESARSFFGVEPDPTLEEMQAIADRYPVFRSKPLRTAVYGSRVAFDLWVSPLNNIRI